MSEKRRGAALAIAAVICALLLAGAVVKAAGSDLADGLLMGAFIAAAVMPGLLLVLAPSSKRGKQAIFRAAAETAFYASITVMVAADEVASRTVLGVAGALYAADIAWGWLRTRTEKAASAEGGNR